jgi:hypothetical protein
VGGNNMSEDEKNQNQDDPIEPNSPRPEIVDMDPRIIKKAEPPADYVEIIQNIEKRKA